MLTKNKIDGKDLEFDSKYMIGTDIIFESMNKILLKTENTKFNHIKRITVGKSDLRCEDLNSMEKIYYITESYFQKQNNYVPSN